MNKRRNPRRTTAQLFDLSKSTDYVRGGNDGYLACLLDRGYVGVRPPKGIPLGVSIRLGESHARVRRTWDFILKNWRVKGSIVPQELNDLPSHTKARALGVRGRNDRTVWRLVIDDPGSVLTLCQAALRFSERPDRLVKAIDAAKEIMNRKKANQ